MADDHGPGTYITTNAADRLQRDAAEQLAYWRSKCMKGRPTFARKLAHGMLNGMDWYESLLVFNTGSEPQLVAGQIFKCAIESIATAVSGDWMIIRRCVVAECLA